MRKSEAEDSALRKGTVMRIQAGSSVWDGEQASPSGGDGLSSHTGQWTYVIPELGAETGIAVLQV